MASYRDWLAIAERDLQAAENMGQAGFYEHACFWCQQAVEKALKALLIYKKHDFPKSHSLRELAIKAGVFPQLKDRISDLDADYAATRYLGSTERPAQELYTLDSYKGRLASATESLEMIRKWMED